jgi:hypothetical protein
MGDAADPELTPERRLSNVAALLAHGVRRRITLLRLTASPTDSKTPEISAKCLELPPNPRLSGSRRSGV